MTKFLTRWQPVVIGIVMLLVGAGYFWLRPGDSSSLLYQSEMMQLSIKSTYLTVNVADTNLEKITGLSNRPSLGSDEGMLFIYDQPTTPSFWMKDMHFAIDIIWISSDKVVVGIEHNVRPETYPKRLQPSVPVRYVLEVRAGFSKDKGISFGDKVNF